MNIEKKDIESKGADGIKESEFFENLTFLDGVLVTWKIFEKILEKRLTDENGEPEKGICNGHSYDYLGIIQDDIAEYILDGVLEHGYYKIRKDRLINQFGVEIN